eukprot:UN16612
MIIISGLKRPMTSRSRSFQCGIQKYEMNIRSIETHFVNHVLVLDEQEFIMSFVEVIVVNIVRRLLHLGIKGNPLFRKQNPQTCCACDCPQLV